MSDHALLLISTIAEVLILSIMIYEVWPSRQTRVEGKAEVSQPERRRYWRWIIIAVAATIAWLAVYLTYRNTQNQPAPSPISSAQSSGPPTSFSQQFLQNLRSDFLRIPRPCILKIIAPQDEEGARDQLVSAAINAAVQFLNRPNTQLIPACQIVDEEKDRTPLLYGPHEFPPLGITIHTSNSNLETREFLAEVFRSQGIRVTGDSALSPGSPDNLIYIEFGHRLY